MKYDLQLLLQVWNLSNVVPFNYTVMTDNFVAKVYSNEYGCDVVIKIGCKEVIDQELIALQYFQGDACVKLLKFDQKIFVGATVLMLEYVEPGTNLKDLYLQGKEDLALDIFIQLIQKLHMSPLNEKEQKKYAHVQTVTQKLSFLDRFEPENDRLRKLLPQAIVIKNRLLETQGDVYFLHGDLHHENILQADKDFVIIDPQGVIGELSCEVGAYIRNPIFILFEHYNLPQLFAYRFDRLSIGLHLDRQRMIQWVFVQTFLAACYHQDDEQEKGRNYFIMIAELIADKFL